MREDKDKLSHWRHPLGFNLNQRSGISRITLSSLYALRLSVLRFFFLLHFNFISFFSSAVLSCVPLSGFSPRTKLLRRKRFDYKAVLAPEIFFPCTHVHMFEGIIQNSNRDSSSVASNSGVHI